MSKMTNEASLTARYHSRAVIPDKQPRILDLIQAISLPLLDNEGGSLAFSYMKKLSMFDSG